MTTAQRFVSLRLLELLCNLTAKRHEIERVGIRFEVMAELHEQVGNALFQVNGINPAQANTLWIMLEDYVSGRIKDFELLSLLAGSGKVPNN
ncbi:hypothetical protein PSTEL_13160 [Paenibacillus stellifer]|uniref:Uncharacterized protein n=1 Tax=Paenibacillus stellifer TaxID=169760 RepID=A0A089LUX6_9BACL|nr:hypothetical protein [Paenibacillus stellifer]AIQ63890.1 hypothetical protein PSTEL_13160 [Paenibacillus stellifer]